ncbi:ferredoxin [Glaciimonas sp. PCH181]|uniref:ferredoxin n=1 Tax=Glaciimonas sp. PCH181 TaxID=2133943 RepID=UPI002102BB57|nr:ferredoxin [Glaciimonas sp. PCH181]
MCATLCPEVFKLDAEGLVYVESEFIPVGFENEAKDGAAACPAEAIIIETVTA